MKVRQSKKRSGGSGKKSNRSSLLLSVLLVMGIVQFVIFLFIIARIPSEDSSASASSAAGAGAGAGAGVSGTAFNPAKQSSVAATNRVAQETRKLAHKLRDRFHHEDHVAPMAFDEEDGRFSHHRIRGDHGPRFGDVADQEELLASRHLPAKLKFQAHNGEHGQADGEAQVDVDSGKEEQHQQQQQQPVKHAKQANMIDDAGGNDPPQEISQKRVLVVHSVKTKTQPKIKLNTNKGEANDKVHRNELVFLHIGKNGGTSFDTLGKHIAMEIKYKYVGFRHFDWVFIDKLKKHGPRVDVVTLLREPVSRAISHFYFFRRFAYAPKSMKSRTINEWLLESNEQELLDSRDAWQDGQAAVSWLTGTHIASWVGCTKAEIPAKEEKAKDHVAMLQLAAERLDSTRWFGILEDLPRSMELLQHEFQLEKTPTMARANQARKTQRVELTDEAREVLRSLIPQDLWLYDYSKLLFEARWNHYQTGTYVPPEMPPIPQQIPCWSNRFHLQCGSGPLAERFPVDKVAD